MTETPPDAGHSDGPRLEVHVAEREYGCRCGTPIPRTGEYLGVAGLPASLEALYRGVAFCSLACVRAGFLEDLSVLEAITTPDAERQVSDLREMHLRLSLAFRELFDAPVPEVRVPPQRRVR